MVFSICFYLLVILGTATAYDQSLQSCKTVAAKFRNTCIHGDYDTPANPSVASMKSEPFACSPKHKCIPAGVKNGDVCTWERRLCVTCRVDPNDGLTRIRIQTNNLPDHCMQSIAIKAQNFDTEMVFNAKKTQGTSGLVENLITQNEVNNAVCPIKKFYDATALKIQELGPVDERAESSNAIGIALNGVAFQFANQIQEDPVFPKTVLNEQPLDLCLGHNQRNSESGMYHYHGVSPCIIDPADFLKDKTMGECTSTPECVSDKVKWALSGFEHSTTKTVMGIGKDGHVIYGPYNKNGKLWEIKDVDACNGAWDSSDYYYVGTRWHPYVVGCLGPATQPHIVDFGLEKTPIYATCSTNGMDKYAVADTTDSNSTTGTSTTSPTSNRRQPRQPTSNGERLRILTGWAVPFGLLLLF